MLPEIAPHCTEPTPFAFGDSGGWFIGTSNFFLQDLDLAAIPEGGLSPGTSFFFQAVFASKALPVKGFDDLAGKTVGVTRGAIEDQELTKIAPASADIKRFEDNNATVSAFISGQVQLIATGASVAGNMMVRNPQLGTG